MKIIKVLIFTIALIGLASSEVLIMEAKSHLKFSVSNPFNYTIQIKRTGTPFDSCYDGIRVFCDETELNRTNSRIECSSKNKDKFLSLEPGEVKAVLINLEEHFKLSTDSELYTVWWEPINLLQEPLETIPFLLNLSLPDQNDSDPQYARTEKRNLRVTTATNFTNQSLVIFSLSRSNNLTILTENKPKGLPREEAYLNLVVESIEAPMWALIQKAINYLESDEPRKLYYFRTWFDKSGSAKSWKTVLDIFYDMQKKMTQGFSFNIDSTSDRCRFNKTVAYRKRSEPDTIQLCYPRFFNQEHPRMGVGFFPNYDGDKTPKRSPGHVITALHELAHIAGVHAKKGVKEVYDREQVLLLAETDPERALKNAQSYSYFINSLRVTLKLTSIKGWGIGVRSIDDSVRTTGSSQTMSLECHGEFPVCDGLYDPQTYKYLSMQSPSPIDKDQREWAKMKDKPMKWQFAYKGNGAYVMWYSWNVSRLGVNELGNLIQQNNDISQTSRWLVSIDGFKPHSRVMTLTDKFGDFPYYLDGKAVKCGKRSANVLKVAMIGPTEKFVMKVRNVDNRYMARGSALWDNVIISTDADWFSFDCTSGDINKLIMKDEDKSWKNRVYCEDGSVWTDGFFDSWKKSVSTFEIGTW